MQATHAHPILDARISYFFFLDFLFLRPICAEIVFCIFEPIKLDLTKQNEMSKRGRLGWRAGGRIGTIVSEETEWDRRAHTQYRLAHTARTQQPASGIFLGWFPLHEFSRFADLVAPFCVGRIVCDANKIAGFDLTW